MLIFVQVKKNVTYEYYTSPCNLGLGNMMSSISKTVYVLWTDYITKDLS